MRQRYYNPEIKRFVNQDILTGSIGNSQSLNRYSYVQGNPVSYTDPFGLSPLNGLFSGTMLIHTVCELLGWIPGPVGAIANVVDGLVYLFVDKDYKNAFYSLGTAVTFGAGKIVAAVGKGSKTALNIQRGCNAIGNGINFLQSAEGTYQTASMMVDKYIVQGQPLSGSTVLEFALLGANMFGAYKSGTYVGNDIADFGGYLKRSWNSRNASKAGDANWEAHNVVNYVKLKEQYRVSELANDVIDSISETGKLPSNYITKNQARTMGWSEGKALHNYAPGKAIGGDDFANNSGVLPSANGRSWYEADVGIDYTMSRSNPKNPAYRILYSNDGLIYGTYDHYNTVFKIHP